MKLRGTSRIRVVWMHGFLGDIVTRGQGSAQVKFNSDGGTVGTTLRRIKNGGFTIVDWKRDGEIAGTSDLPTGEPWTG